MVVTVSTDQAGRNPIIRAKQRSGMDIIRDRASVGIRAADFVAESVYGEHPLAVQVKKPSNLIETARVEGVDLLTAKDIALHEFLIAHARHEGIRLPEHNIDVGRMLSFLGIREIGRLEESLSRLSRTVIRYDVTDLETGKRIKSWPQMITLSLEEDLKSGTPKISYSIPKALRTAMIQSRGFLWLDLNVLPRLKSKYAARLYPKLALIAGHDVPLRKPWVATPDEIGDFLGFPKTDGKFAAADLRRAVETAVEQINEHAVRFEVELKLQRDAGRGRPIAAFRFDMLTSSIMQGKSLRAAKAVRLKKGVRLDINALLHTLPEDRRPSWSAIGRAAGYTGIHTDEILTAWTRHCEKAAAMGPDDFGSEKFVEEEFAKAGVDSAFFKVIARDHKHHGRDPYAAASYTSAQDQDDVRKKHEAEHGRPVPRSEREVGETWIEGGFEYTMMNDSGYVVGRSIRTQDEIDRYEASVREHYERLAKERAERDEMASWTRRVTIMPIPANMMPAPTTTRRAGPPPPPAPTPALAPRDADFDLPLSGRVIETSDEIPF